MAQAYQNLTDQVVRELFLSNSSLRTRLEHLPGNNNHLINMVRTRLNRLRDVLNQRGINADDLLAGQDQPQQPQQQNAGRRKHRRRRRRGSQQSQRKRKRSQRKRKRLQRKRSRRRRQ